MSTESVIDIIAPIQDLLCPAVAMTPQIFATLRYKER
jgi:hypothetical protein